MVCRNWWAVKGERLNAVSEQDPLCLRVLRSQSPVCVVWKDIRAATKKDIESSLNSHPNAEGGSPRQCLSQLNVDRLHFEDQRSNLFFELKRVMDLVEEICLERGLASLVC